MTTTDVDRDLNNPQTPEPRKRGSETPTAIRIMEYVVLALLVLLLVAIITPQSAGRGIMPGPDTTRVSWSTSRADTTKVKATFLFEAEATTGHNASADGIYVADPPGGTQRVGLIAWAESIPDSVPADFTSATLTLYRLNGTDAAAEYDTLEVAPVTVTWNEVTATWMSRSVGKLWATSGGDVNTSLAVLVRAETIPNLCSGPADSAVTFDITPIVTAWRDHAVGSYGVRLAWRTGVASAVRFHDNAAAESLRPVLTVRTDRVSYSIPVGRSTRGVSIPGGTHVGRSRHR